jgi:O-antigen/teichoic acid export membrane protein
VFADPMLRNGHALIFSAGVTQAIGVLYWAVAARNYPAAVVGRNSAAISITLFLAGIAELNLMSTLVRFLPTSGARSVRLILTAYAASIAVAAAIGTAFLLLIPRVEPQLDFLRSGPFLGAWFVVSVITGAIFVLQDSALTGVRAAPFVPLENATFSVLKLVMMVALVGVVPASGIYVSWTAGFALAVIPTNVYLFARAIPRYRRQVPTQPPPPRFADIRGYFLIDSTAGFFMLASTALLPLMIIDRLGATAAGHYAMAWMISFALYLVSLNMGSSLVVETAADQSGLRERSLRCITHLAKLIVPAVAVIILAAPYLLLLFGPGYARADTGALRLLALCALPALITNTALNAARSQRRMATVAGIQIAICTMVWGLSALLMGSLGINGVGAAWLVAQTATAAVLVAWPRLWLPPAAAPRHRSTRRRGRPGSKKPDGGENHEAASAELHQLPGDATGAGHSVAWARLRHDAREEGRQAGGPAVERADGQGDHTRAHRRVGGGGRGRSHGAAVPDPRVAGLCLRRQSRGKERRVGRREPTVRDGGRAPARAHDGPPGRSPRAGHRGVLAVRLGVRRRAGTRRRAPRRGGHGPRRPGQRPGHQRDRAPVVRRGRRVACGRR